MAIKDIPLPDWEDLTDLLGLELDEPSGLDLLDLGGYVGEQAYEQLRPDPWAEADPWAAPLAGGIAGLLPIGAAFGLPDIPGVELTRLARALRRAPVLDPAFTKAIESLRKIPNRQWRNLNQQLMELKNRPGLTTREMKEQISKWTENLERGSKEMGRPWRRRSGWRESVDAPMPYTPGRGIRGPIRTDITKAPPGSYTGRKYLPPARGGGGLTEFREGMRKSRTLPQIVDDTYVSPFQERDLFEETIQAVRKAGYTRKQTGEFMEYLTKKVKQAQDEFWKNR